MQIDEKLQQVCDKYIDDRGNTNYIGLIDGIKAAFTEAGWHPPHAPLDIQSSRRRLEVKVPELPFPPKVRLRIKAHEALDAYLDAGGPDDFVIMSRNDWKRNAALSGYMHGSEWLKGFFTELEYIPSGSGNFGEKTYKDNDIIRAARRAAGIEGEK